MPPTSSPPPQSVLQAFHLSGNPKPLAGGQGESFILGDVVLKPTADTAETEWVSSIQSKLAQSPNPHYRIATPIPLPHSNPPQYVFERWTATRFISGVGSPHVRLQETLAASRALHADLKNLVSTPPAFLHHRTHRWAHADRLAWQEISIADIPHINHTILATLSPYLTCLSALLDPLPPPSLHNQLIHGDLGGRGNLLFNAPEEPPAIIDFSPYWRPVDYAEAIIVGDELLWHAADEATVRRVGLEPFRLQMLVRAVIFRTLTFAIHPNMAFIQTLLPNLDVERTVILLERLCRSRVET